MRCLVLDIEENKMYKEGLINSVVFGEVSGEYVVTDKGTFLKSCLKELKTPKTNKTKVIKSINIYDYKTDTDVKEILRLKKMLRNLKVNDDEYTYYVEYVYNKFIELYYWSNLGNIHFSIKYDLENAINLILDSEVSLNDGFELREVKRWREWR